MNYGYGTPGYNPFAPPHAQTKPSGWAPATYPMVAGDFGNKSSGWRQPTYPLTIGADDPNTGNALSDFLIANKYACAIGAAIVVGGAAYYMGYR